MKKPRNSIALLLLTAGTSLLGAIASGAIAAGTIDAVASNTTSKSQTIWSARVPSSFSGETSIPFPNIITTAAKGDVASASIVFKPNDGINLFSSLLSDQAQDGHSASVPWCAEASGFLRIGSLGQECLMRGTLQFELPGQVASAQTGMNIRGERWDLTVNYGVSRLVDNIDIQRMDPSTFIPGLTNIENSPILFNVGKMEAQGIALGGQWRLTQASALQLNAALNQLRLYGNSFATPILNLNRADGSVGLEYGAFSGNITGYVQSSKNTLQPVDDTALWGGLDIGVSWRTPWRGELTVGARNLVTKGDKLPSLDSPGLEMSSTRTPYVRYKQDL